MNRSKVSPTCNATLPYKYLFHEKNIPVFMGLLGVREKAEKGRGLFERSEFRSPRRREKRKAGKPDNERETFLGYFFALGKKLRSFVILNIAQAE